MPNIQDSPYPLVFPLTSLPTGIAPTTQDGLRTTARALTGMQNEAVVAAASGTARRMVCDEGPYLNGTSSSCRKDSADLIRFGMVYLAISGEVNGWKI